MKFIVLALALSAPAAAVKLVSSLKEDLTVNLMERPVMKVVRLLTDMKLELEKEMEDDKAVHEMLSCWCTKNEQEKEAAIASEKAKISQLESAMDGYTAKIAELKEKRAATMEEIESDTKALGKATELRMKENKAFHASETDLVQAIDAAKNAIIVLSKHNPELAQLKAVARQLLDPRVSQLISNSDRIGKATADYVTHFMQKAEVASSFLAIPGMKSYAPQSGQIFGILKQLKEDFEANLSEEQKTEMKAQADYEALKAAKEDEIETGKKLVVDLDAGIAENQEKYADDAKELKNTEEMLGLDTEFVASLEKKCSETSAEFDARMKDRMEELEAVSDTINILNSDESFQAFDKMKAPSFFQVAARDKNRRQRAASIIQQVLKRTGFGQLLVVASSIELDAFTKVKEVIDKVIAQLKVQQEEEVQHRDWCTDELNKNKRMTDAGYDKKESLTVKIADLEKSIETFKSDIASSKAAIEEMVVQMHKASQTREGENADYQITITDHHVMSLILKKALERMKEVYAFLQEQEPGAPHIQTSGNHTDPGNGPARFTKYSQNAGGGRVVSMLEKIIAEVQATTDEAMRTEQDSQSAYENFMKDSNKSIKKTQQAITDMTSDMAQAKEDLSMAKADFKGTMTDLEGLDATNADLHKSCDFVLKNFAVRQQARADEMDALAEAKAVLSGAQ